jgi:hypothetical protein
MLGLIIRKGNFGSFQADSIISEESAQMKLRINGAGKPRKDVVLA